MTNKRNRWDDPKGTSIIRVGLHRRIITAGVLIALSPCSAHAADDLHEVAEAAIHRLFQARKFDDLKAVIAKWKSDLSQTAQRWILADLVEKSASAEPLDIQGVHKVAARGALPYWELPTTRPREPWLKTLHDLNTVGGRNAWAIEEMLLCDVDPRSLCPTDEDYRLYLANVVIRRMSLPSAARLTSLSVDERLALASLKGLTHKLARELAFDDDPKVRRAIAGNRGADREFREMLTQDPDPSVREAAKRTTRGSEPASGPARTNQQD